MNNDTHPEEPVRAPDPAFKAWIQYSVLQAVLGGLFAICALVIVYPLFSKAEANEARSMTGAVWLVSILGLPLHFLLFRAVVRRHFHAKPPGAGLDS